MVQRRATALRDRLPTTRRIRRDVPFQTGDRTSGRVIQQDPPTEPVRFRLLGQLTKLVLESALEGEITAHLGYDKHERTNGAAGGNTRNGTRSKTVLTKAGPVEVDVPRDRAGWFEPVVVGKRQRRFGSIENIVLSLSARGMTHGGISAHEAEERFLEFQEEWGQRYPAIVRLWSNSWAEFVPFLQFDREIRRIMCTTNAIEAVNARIRKAVRARGHFPNEQAALKCVYLAVMALDPTGTGRARWTRALEASPQRVRYRFRRSALSAPNLDHYKNRDTAFS